MSFWRKLDFSTNDSKAPPGSLEINFDNYLSCGKHRLIGSKYRAIRHSEQINKIEKFINENKRHGFNLDLIKVPFKEKDTFFNQLRIFILKLKTFSIFQKEYKLKSKYDLGEILLGTLKEGFKFNSTYKKKIDSDTREYLRGETDLVYQDYPASHLIPWLDEEPIEEIYVFDEPLKINQKELDGVVNIMDENILDDALIRDIDLIDAFYLINNKKMNHLNDKGRTKTSFDCRGEDLDISFPHCELDYLFKKVTTDPATSRMAGLPTVKTRNVGYAAHSNLDRVTCSKSDLYKEGVDPKLWKDKLSKLDDGYFIMIDFKKSGLTTNREVIKSVYRTALKHYDKFRPFVCYLDCLENIRVNGSLSKRGTSLGMDDNALSFFLSCAFERWKYQNSQYMESVEGYFKGDDQVIICRVSLEETRVIFRSWLKTLKKLGLLVNAKKSFIGERGQFCEVVGRGQGIDTKVIEFSLNNFDALGCYNHVDFKIFINNLKRVFDKELVYSRIFDYCLVTTMFSVEPEFNTTDELYAPFEMGGYFSNYVKGLNTFIEDVLSSKYDHLERRLFNVIGVDRPTQSYEYKRKNRVFESIFKDVNNIVDKLRKISAEPMSKLWRESYDFCLQERKRAYEGPIELKGSRIQKLLDFKENFALPVSHLVLNPRQEKHFVPSRKLKPQIRKKLMGKKLPKTMINKIEKNYYFIDEIRAKELLYGAKTGENRFLINFYYPLPASTLIWSTVKYFARTKWAVPMKWAEYCYATKISLDNLWSYYASMDINLYDYEPRDTSYNEGITEMFRGPKNADTITICPYSGFPIRFSSWEYYAWKENRNKPKRFYLDLVDHYYREWLDLEHQNGWYGPNDRNRPLEKEKFFRVYKEVTVAEDYAVSSQYYDELVMNYTTYYPETIELFQEEIVEEPVEVPENISYESEYRSDSDILEEYFRDNPLNDDTDDELDPYQNLSSSSDENEE